MDFNDVRKVVKPWGHELLFAVEDEYVGKILDVKKGRKLSLQYHKQKKETMYIFSGLVRLTIGDEEREVEPGQSITIVPGTVHRVHALKDSLILEVSTTELDDVVRLEDDYHREAD